MESYVSIGVMSGTSWDGLDLVACRFTLDQTWKFEIVKAVQELRAAQNQDAVFKQELAELRLTWKAKRNFMKLLATFD